MNIKVRHEVPEDVVSIQSVNDAAFIDSTEESNIVDRLRKNGDLTVSLVAICNDNVVGHIAFSPITIDSMKVQGKFVGLAPMAVRPKFQGKGIGGMLITKGLRLLSEMETNAVFVLGHASYYPKFGFLPAFSTFGIKSIYEAPDEAFMALELKKDSLKSVSGVAYYSRSFS